MDWYVVKVRELSQRIPVVIDWVRVPSLVEAVMVFDWAGFVFGLVIVITGAVVSIPEKVFDIR